MKDKPSFNAFFSTVSDLLITKPEYDKEYILSLYNAFLDSKFDSMEEFLKSFFNLK